MRMSTMLKPIMRTARTSTQVIITVTIMAVIEAFTNLGKDQLAAVSSLLLLVVTFLMNFIESATDKHIFEIQVPAPRGGEAFKPEV